MDLGSKSQQELVLEYAAVASDDQSTATNLDLSAPNKASTSETTHDIRDESQSIYATVLAFEDIASVSQCDVVKSSSVETYEQTVSMPSSPRSDEEEPQPRTLMARIKPMLHQFETLTTRLESTSRVNDETDTTIHRLLQSVQFGIGDLQVCIGHVNSNSSVLNGIILYHTSCHTGLLTADVSTELQKSSNN